MKLPNAQPLAADFVARVANHLGREQLANALFVTVSQLDVWATKGIAAGPTAACFRYLAAALQMPSTSAGACVLCGSDASELIAYAAVCSGCCNVSSESVQPLGIGYWEERFRLSGIHRFVGISATRSFERPMLATFSPQWSSRRKDPEVGDEVFDAAVWIETDDYEAVFDTFQHVRRRQLVYNITRTGSLKVDVNDLVYDYTTSELTAPIKELPIWMVLLAWSLLYETSNPWDFA